MIRAVLLLFVLCSSAHALGLSGESLECLDSVYMSLNPAEVRH